MRSAVHKRISDLDARQWNALNGTNIPFLRHEFFSALEHTGCIGSRTWSLCSAGCMRRIIATIARGRSRCS